MFYWLFLKKSQLYNFAAGNTISTEENNTDDLLKILIEEAESVVQWFTEHGVINLDKFQAMVLQKGNKSKSTNIKLNVDNIATNTTKSVELLGVTIAIKFNFEEHISVRCRKASLQLNAMNRLQKNMVKKEEVITNSFISANFDHCPLV